MTIGSRIIGGIGIFLVLLNAVSSQGFAADKKIVIPNFKVIGKYRSVVNVLVNKNTNNNEIKALIIRFREARASSTLGSINIPPTTPGGSKGPYGIIQIFVFSESEWSDINKYIRTEKDLAYTKKWNKHVRGYYFGGIGQDLGMVGFKEDGVVYTKDYVEIFKQGI